MKLLGALLIIFSTSWMGMLGGRRLADRPRQLEKLRSDLMLLEMEINYSITPLPQVLQKLASYSHWPINYLWQRTFDNLSNGEGLTAEEAWIRSLESFASKAALSNNDFTILKDFGSGLGLANRQEQVKKFKLLQEQLRAHQKEAEQIKQKSERIWRTMGVLGGIALVILLY